MKLISSLEYKIRPISNEADFLSGVPDQAQSLCNEISLMTSALRDASEKRQTRNEVEEWLKQVRDVVMNAEDVIDLFIFGAERERHRNFLTRYICYPNQLLNLHQFGKEIENSIKKINQLSIRRSSLGLETNSGAESSSSIRMITNIEQGLPFRRRQDRVVDDFYVIGFEKEENEIVKKLVTPIVPQRPCPATGVVVVVSIVGMGGSGKTTLARNVYKRNDVKEHFQTRAWISVSQQYDIRDLLPCHPRTDHQASHPALRIRRR
ncbi:putative disease resistance protein At1g50180 isoform X2 [Telopea speciosissima]|uniref:putative disease resistance protein At1g50180 isoform X2 n=1 Tax=Telopea speciosissima TaxID=54955 RepID=UPI001CC5D0FE|nr:putative disease resistance protein At1g50180 isoform X2 [Telopea speciosissima]